MAAHIVSYFYVDFTIGKQRYLRVTHGDTERSRNLIREGGVGGPREDHQSGHG
jgi:hypothetical protein